MSQNKFLENLLSQEMNRREFLTRIGAAGLTMIGVTGLLKSLSGLSSTPTKTSYGATPYGGDRKSDTVSTYEKVL